MRYVLGGFERGRGQVVKGIKRGLPSQHRFASFAYASLVKQWCVVEIRKYQNIRGSSTRFEFLFVVPTNIEISSRCSSNPPSPCPLLLLDMPPLPWSVALNLAKTLMMITATTAKDTVTGRKRYSEKAHENEPMKYWVHTKSGGRG